MQFERRDLMLLAGSALIGIALMGFFGIVAIIVPIGIFCGIKAFSASRKTAILRQAGDGFCAACGTQVTGGSCPNCG